MSDDVGELALRFVNTVDLRWSAADDRLVDYGTLLEWAADQRLLTTAQHRHLAEAATGDPTEAAAAFATATAFRESLYRVLEPATRRAHPDRDDLAQVNDRLALCRQRLRADEPGQGFVLELQDVGPPLEVMLGPIAQSAVRLLTGETRRRLRACPGSPGHACGWLFVDGTKNGNRRYCVSALCANRARATRYRQRHHRRSPQ